MARAAGAAPRPLGGDRGAHRSPARSVRRGRPQRRPDRLPGGEARDQPQRRLQEPLRRAAQPADEAVGGRLPGQRRERGRDRGLPRRARSPGPTGVAMTLRCLIVDDSEAVLRAAADLLAGEGMIVAGVATNGADAVRLVEELEPDVVLVDIVLGAESGFDLVRRLIGTLE